MNKQREQLLEKMAPGLAARLRRLLNERRKKAFVPMAIKRKDAQAQPLPEDDPFIPRRPGR